MASSAGSLRFPLEVEVEAVFRLNDRIVGRAMVMTRSVDLDIPILTQTVMGAETVEFKLDREYMSTASTNIAARLEEALAGITIAARLEEALAATDEDV